jgi:putative N6-adenine-specific DNA methylase
MSGIYMFSYQKNNRYFAQVAEGVELIAAKEISELGATEVKESYRGLYFSADKATLYRINLCSRLCSTITASLILFDCHSSKYLYKTAIKQPWELLLDEDKSFVISATVANSKIKHSQYAAQVLKDAIVDYFRERSGRRPSIDKRTPDLWLDLYISNNKATISINTSGESLHRRGYRAESVEAPMQETLAATIIKFSGWDGSKPLIDPMCGSGTLLCEALMQYANIPANMLRQHFGFQTLPDFDPTIWETVKNEAAAGIRTIPAGLIIGSDSDSEAIQSAKTNAANIGAGKKIHFSTKAFQKLPEIKNSVIVCNPPYGIRLKKKNEAEALLEEFGNFLKQSCTGSTAFIYLGKKELLKSVGLKPSWKKNLNNGGLEGVLAKYNLY